MWKSEIKEQPDYNINRNVRQSRMISRKAEALKKFFRDLANEHQKISSASLDNQKVLDILDNIDDMIFELGDIEEFLNDIFEA